MDRRLWRLNEPRCHPGCGAGEMAGEAGGLDLSSKTKRTLRWTKNMSEINFQPYIGPLYKTSAVRLLIVGESHYEEPSSDPAESTRTVVENWRSQEWNLRFLTIAARIVTGQSAWELDRKTAFNAVAFYNFVQVLMPTKAHRPTTTQVRASWSAFREVLAACDPTHIVATGRFLWNNMPPTDRVSGDIVLDGIRLNWREYSTSSGHIRTISLPHLSRASAPQWHGAVKAFLAEPAAI